MNMRLAVLCAVVFASPVFAWQSAPPAAAGAKASPPGTTAGLGYASPVSDPTRPNTPADAKLVTTIHQSLGQVPSLAGGSQGITVIVSEGAVVLRGEVASEADKAHVDSIVRQISGVTEVTDELDVAL
jgi:hyperosmotically inducible protein